MPHLLADLFTISADYFIKNYYHQDLTLIYLEAGFYIKEGCIDADNIPLQVRPFLLAVRSIQDQCHGEVLQDMTDRDRAIPRNRAIGDGISPARVRSLG